MAYSMSHMSNPARVGSTISARVLGICFPPISNMTHLLILVSLDRLAVTRCVNAIDDSQKSPFPHVFSATGLRTDQPQAEAEIQAKTRTGPRLKHAGGDVLGSN